MKLVRLSHRAAGTAAWSVAMMFVASSAMAGPPFRTDDPEPVDYQHYELYTLSTGVRNAVDASGVSPALEFNYGFAPNAHIHIIVPAVSFDAPNGMTTQFGYGDTELGVKYRFINEDKNGWLPQVGTFPITILPTGAENRGLGAGHVRQFLPLWVQKSFGDWTTYGGGGYWINHGSDTDDKDYWFFGGLLQRKITDKLTLGGEIFHQTADKIGGKDSTAFNIGGYYNLDDHNHILFSAGRGIQNASESNLFSWYVAYLITN
ncbi:MAG: transporter [Xanthobacteraceae bacterium]